MTEHSATNADATTEPLLTGYPGRILLLILAGTVAAFVGRNIFGPLLPAIIETLGITSSEAGIALTVMWASIAITQYPGGLLSDQLSYKTVLVGSIAILSTGFVILTGVTTYVGFVFGLVVMGLGAGLFTPSSYAQLADLFEARRGQAFGLYTSAIDVGTSLSGALATLVLAVATWRFAGITVPTTWHVSFAPVVAVLVLVAATLHVGHRGDYDLDLGACELNLRETVARILGNPLVRWAIVAYVMYSFIFQGILGFLPAFLRFGKGYSQTFANNAFIGFFLVGAVVRIVAGYLGDRMRHLTVAIGAALLGMAGLLVLFVAQSTVPLVAGLGLLAVGITGFPPVVNAYLMGLFPDASMGGDYGGARTLLIFLGSLGPTYIGSVAQAFDYELAFAALLPFFLVSTVCLCWLRLQ
ncbi:MFS transporter [Haloplanus halophilus]|uniref:MFS transporter n=1 Tax=Haloplanus halophilus TaxID=2949993 RepID=UPI002040FE07|nr:MFS transporter [Haloplanus sp. GDY1]